jgi:nucleoid DNA-binding protein
MTQTDTKNIQHQTWQEILEAVLIRGETVEIRGLGTFFLKTLVPGRIMRNPKTGEQVVVAGVSSVSFRPGKYAKKIFSDDLQRD